MSCQFAIMPVRQFTCLLLSLAESLAWDILFWKTSRKRKGQSKTPMQESNSIEYKETAIIFVQSQREKKLV